MSIDHGLSHAPTCRLQPTPVPTQPLFDLRRVFLAQRKIV
ncbi:hypothetical protein USDA257_p05850 (plasmid) [Sinorhizobium fredii USDA 257]|uniref:Uncharacterized protein n=1 Tax=Sinorhizobium fredii (strain USDA 257) TaxID=1185652 RepID=I3XHE4_SINF2|nr:hypothetical protein USDA257_p05850 [Sinorhizobium fredii USDA 257]